MAKKIEAVKNEQYMHRFFRRHLNQFWPGARRITFFHCKFMKFLSEESYTMKYDVDVLMKNGQIQRKVIRGNRVPKPTYDMMRAYYPYFTKHRQQAIARPLFYIDDLGFILYEEYEGSVIREYDHQINTLTHITPSIAHRLADLHNRQLHIGQLRTWRDEANYFDLCQKKVKQFMPRASKRFDPLKEKYLNGLKKMYDTKQAISIHGDFQASNIIYDLRTKQVGIIDFSSTSIFSPANDVATFMTHARAMECFIYPAAKVDALEKLFITTYLKRANKKLGALVRRQLPLFMARISLDIITTTAVFTKYNKSPHFLKIITTMFARATDNLRKIKTQP